MFGDNKDQMDPQDIKRLFLFFVLAIFIYMGYNHYILEPQNKAIQAAAKAELIQGQTEKAINALEYVAPLPQKEIINQTKQSRLEIENNSLYGSLNLTGGRIDDIHLNDYYKTLENKDTVAVVSPKGTERPRYIEYGWVAADASTPVPSSNTKWNAPEGAKLTSETPITLSWDNGKGLIFQRTISIDDQYMFTVAQRVLNKSDKSVTLYPYGLISQTGVPKGIQKTWLLHEGPMGYIGDSLLEVDYDALNKGKFEKEEATQGWIGITDKYWLTSIIPPQGQNVKYTFKYSGTPKDKNNTGRYQTDFVGSALTVAPYQTGEVESRLFTGAKRVLLLSEYRDNLNIPKFDLAVNFGWFWFLSKPFFYALHYLGELVGNMGLAIILLTILIRGSVFPLTNASYRSFAKMKKVSPLVAELREKHADDKQKLQTELMQLYQSEGVNPMAGCFPILLQIPIFFALYKVLFVTIEIRHAPFYGWIKDLSAQDPTSIFNLFGLIDWAPPQFMMIGVWPCIMLLAMIVQKKLNPPPQDALQRQMMAIFPFFITYILSRFASGLVIYWTFSAVIGIIQQLIIMRSLDVPIYLFGQAPEEERIDKSVDKGPAVHPLIDMAEEDMEDALFGEPDNAPKKEIKPPKPKKKKKKK